MWENIFGTAMMFPYDNLNVIYKKINQYKKKKEECIFAGAAYLALLWKWECESDCSKIGLVVRVSSRCAGGIVIIVCKGESGFVLQNAEVAYLSSPFWRKKKEEKKIFVGA